MSSLGIAENITDVEFDSNTFYCSSGTYGYEMDALDPEVRDTVAALNSIRCSVEQML